MNMRQDPKIPRVTIHSDYIHLIRDKYKCILSHSMSRIFTVIYIFWSFVMIEPIRGFLKKEMRATGEAKFDETS